MTGAHLCVSERKELKKLLAAARLQGWRVECGRGGHYKLYAPDGINLVVVASTPSDRRSIEISAAMMRRYGFHWKGR